METTKANSDKKFILAVVLTVAVIVFGSLWINSIKSGIQYADFDCPVCGSSEVIDFGTDNMNNHSYQCFDCKNEFTINE